MAYHYLDKHVWFGDWQAPGEWLPGRQMPALVVNVAHHFSARRGRNIYWQKLQEMPWQAVYVRLALRDKDHFSGQYAEQLYRAMQLVPHNAPILTHCQMGGHRGPAAAIFCAAVRLGVGPPFRGPSKTLDALNATALELVPGLARARPNGFYYSMMDLLRKQ